MTTMVSLCVHDHDRRCYTCVTTIVTLCVRDHAWVAHP